MAKGGITLKLEGFEDLLKAVEAAGKDVATVSERVVRECAQIAETELSSQYRNGGYPDLAAKVTSKVEVDGNRSYAQIGFLKDDYDPKHLSPFYKALFLNYGTPKRTVKKENVRANLYDLGFKTLGKNRGAETPRGFIANARKAMKPKIRKKQKEILAEITKELGK